MKTTFIIITTGMIALSSIATSLAFNQLYNTDYTYIADEWIKADHWVCKDNKTWFKYEQKDDRLWKSTNHGRNWFESKDGMWNDYDGKFLKINNGKVLWTTDSSHPWTEVPEWKWKGGNNHWYRFDENWNLSELK